MGENELKKGGQCGQLSLSPIFSECSPPVRDPDKTILYMKIIYSLKSIK